MGIQLSDHFTYGKLIRFVLPSILMNVCMSIYSIIDGFFVSNFVSKSAFAAVNLMMPIIMVIMTIGLMIGTGGSAIVSMTMGAQKKEAANRYFSMLISFAFWFAIALAVVVFVFLPQIAVLLGAEGELLKNSVIYGRILCISAPAFVLQQAFQIFFVTAEKPEMSLKMSIVSGVANIVLDWLFIVPMNGGVVGAAVATATAQMIGGLYPIIYFARENDSLLRLSFREKIDFRIVSRACGNGSSEMVSMLSTSAVNILYNLQLMRFAGENGVAAYGVIMYVSTILSAIFMGFSFGTAPIISYNQGADNQDELKNMFKKSLIIIGLSGIVSTAMAIGFARPLSMIFTNYDAELLEMTVRGSCIYGLAYLFMGFNIWGSSFFTALNNGAVSAGISFTRTFVFQILAVLLLPIALQLDGVWGAIVVAEFVSVFVTGGFLLGMKKKYHY